MDDTTSTVSKFQSFIPHTSKHLRRSIDRVMNRGLNEEEVKRFQRIYGARCFKPLTPEQKAAIARENPKKLVGEDLVQEIEAVRGGKL